MRTSWLYVWGIVGLLLSGFWSYGLFDLDEGIYAAALTEMLSRGDWISITYQGEPFFEKPILIYWFGLAFTKLGVPGVAALRFGSILAALGTLAAVASFCRRRLEESTALSGVLLLATSLMFMVMGRMFTPDALLTFAMTGAFLAFWESLVGDKKWRALSGFLLGIAVLAKGPMPVAIFVVLLLYSYRIHGREPLRGYWPQSILLFILTVSAWYLPVFLQNGPAAFNEFIIRQNLGRLAGGDKAHLGPAYYYIPIILACFIPAAVAIPWAWKHARSQPIERYLWAWVVAVFILFSVSGTKLPHYILPLLPPLAILIGRSLRSTPNSYRVAMLAFSAVATTGCWYANTTMRPPLEGLLLPVAAAASIGLLAATIAYYTRQASAVQALAFSFPLCAAVLLIGAPSYWGRAYADVAAIAAEVRRTEGEVVEYRTGGEGRFGETAHPSMAWLSGRPTRPSSDPSQLLGHLNDATLILTRERRLDEARPLLRESGYSVQELSASGRFQLYRVERIP